MKLDSEFIRAWEPRYDEIESDETEYVDLVRLVEKEIRQNETLSKSIFKRIVDWKSQRAKGKVKWEDFERYDRIIRQMLKSSDSEKLGILVSLEGVGPPMASTILHFIYPHEFPIYDRRTVEVLHSSGYIGFKTTSQSGYHEFRKVLLDLKQQLRDWTLRQIDRALFAFHKIELSQAKKCDVLEGGKDVRHRIPVKDHINHHAGLLLEGSVRTLSQATSDGWVRREIIVIQDESSGYPKIGQEMELVDSDGERYKLSCIKGAHVSGCALLGQPGRLKPWFLKHYPKNVVVPDKVFFDSTGRLPNEFRVWTSQEWRRESRRCAMEHGPKKQHPRKGTQRGVKDTQPFEISCIEEQLKRLTPEKLAVVYDFVCYLAEKEHACE